MPRVKRPKAGDTHGGRAVPDWPPGVRVQRFDDRPDEGLISTELFVARVKYAKDKGWKFSYHKLDGSKFASRPVPTFLEMVEVFLHHYRSYNLGQE